jgi:hypothetical protein
MHTALVRPKKNKQEFNTRLSDRLSCSKKNLHAEKFFWYLRTNIHSINFGFGELFFLFCLF